MPPAAFEHPSRSLRRPAVATRLAPKTNGLNLPSKAKRRTRHLVVSNFSAWLICARSHRCAGAGVLPEVGFAAIYGPSGSGKGFLVVHFVAAVAVGAECFGHRAKAGRVIYIMLEGQAGIPKRIEAWSRDAGLAFPDAVQFVFESFRLTDRDDVLGLTATIEAAGGADVVVIDTLNRAAPEADENSAQDMGRVLEAVKMLQSMVGGLVLLVHHTGKESTKGMRGHSSVHAALDAVIEVSRTDDRRE